VLFVRRVLCVGVRGPRKAEETAPANSLRKRHRLRYALSGLLLVPKIGSREALSLPLCFLRGQTNATTATKEAQ